MSTVDGSIAVWLRALPTIPTSVADLDVDALPTDPLELLTERLRTAVDAGVMAPQAMTLATAGPDGPAARTVILKDIADGRLAFATHADSPKAVQLAFDSRVALVFFWPGIGDQVRVIGEAVDLGDTASAADFRARSAFSRASALVGNPSKPLDCRATHADAYAAALDSARHDPDLVEPRWRAYGVTPTEVELWHSSRAGQVRVRYVRGEGDAWTHGLLWP